jgi:hypothetical protein
MSMKQNNSICQEKENIVFPKISINNGFYSNDLKNNMNLDSLFEKKSHQLSFPLPNLSMNESFDINGNNHNSDYLSNETKNMLNKKIYNKTNDSNKVNKNSQDNLLRRVKTIVFDSILKYDNYMISELYNHNLGNGVNRKILLKNNHSQIRCIGKIFNEKLLKTPQREIFSEEITKRYSYFPLDHNKQLINKLLNEEDVIKREKFQKIFDKTLVQCIEHLIGKKTYKELEGLEIIYENEMRELNEEEEYKDKLRQIFKNYEKIFNEKKPRKKKTKKE